MAVHINTLNGGDIIVNIGGSTPAYHEETWYKYDGDTEWRTIMLGGTIALMDDIAAPTGQIENPANIVAIEIGTGTQANPLTNIGQFAFNSCTILTSVTIPDSVTYIESYAFNFCRGLTSVTIPNSVTSIGNSALYGCSSLTNVTFEEKDKATVKDMENYPFGLDQANENGVTIHCTDGDIQVQVQYDE